MAIEFRRSLQCLGSALAIWALAWGGCAPALAAPDAGSVIENRAFADFTDRDGTPHRVASNTVVATVEPLCAVDLTEAPSLVATPGAQVSFSHTVENRGNAAFDLDLAVRNLGDDNFDLVSLEILDNPAPEAMQDAAPVDTTTLPLGPGEAREIMVQARLPELTDPGGQGRLRLQAQCPQTPRQPKPPVAEVIDTIEVAGRPELTVTKAADRATAQRGDTIRFDLSAENIGSGPAAPVALVVDGVGTERVVVVDTIPANTTFVRIDSSVGDLLYHLAGTPEDQWQTQPPSAPATVDRIALSAARLQPGDRLEGRLSVRVNDNAAGTIRNVAEARYALTADTSEAEIRTSEEVQVTVPLEPPRIDFFLDAAFAQSIRQTALGSPLYLAADAALCNEDPLVREQRTLVVTAALTGDEETFIAIESAPNSGIFWVAPPSAPGFIPTQDVAEVGGHILGNGVLETTANDTVIGQLTGCGAAIVETEILIDPSGVVFDSGSGEAVAGAEVTLVNALTGAPAQVLDFDTVTPAPATLVTGADGRFTYPLVEPGQYRLRVVPPSAYAFPSERPRAQLPPERQVDPAASYGEPFPVTLETGAVRVDIPIDPSALGGLFVDKTVDRDEVQLGETVRYTVTVSNVGESVIEEARLVDQLPRGFRYQPGSSRRDEAEIADPAGGVGPELTFELGDLDPGAETTLVYRAVVGVGSLAGDGTNRAWALGLSTATATPRPVQSNVAQAQVRIEPGVFDDYAFIIGKVYMDCNRNRKQDAGELGIPGVRLYLEDGTYVVTDPEGKYSLYGLRPITHVLRIDPITLPLGAQMLVLGNRNAGVGTSRFVDLQRGELHKADFAEGSCTDGVTAAVRARRASEEAWTPEVERVLDRDLPPDGRFRRIRDPARRDATGLVDRADDTGLSSVLNAGSTPADPTLETAPGQDAAAEPDPLQAVPGRVPGVPLETVVGELQDSALDFMNLADGAVLGADQATVRVKGRAGGRLVLRVNGALISEERVGTKATAPATGLSAWEYVGVPLARGRNTLTLQLLDAFGNQRGERRIEVTVPGPAARLMIDAPTDAGVADGMTPVEVGVRVTDADGVPVAARTPITLYASTGDWQTADLDPDTPGLQTAVDGGGQGFSLMAPAAPGVADIEVRAGTLEARERVPFRPFLRPLVANGIVEGIFRLNELDPNVIEPVRGDDGFEQELQGLFWERDDESLQASARVALFLKGRVLGSTLLTLAYDSAKEDSEELFRDIDPDRFYPVYGDSSVRGFDAQSTSRLYVRLDRDNAFALFGDFQTRAEHPARRLGSYDRTLTGLRFGHASERLAIDGFFSMDDSQLRVDEFRGRGISGPYPLAGDPIVNGEQVEIITRDRDQPSLVIDRQRLVRFVDYTIDTVSSGILFKRPVPSLDANLNPVFIRVTYEVEGTGEEFAVGGLSAQVKLTEHWEVGGSYVSDDDPENARRIHSLNTSIAFGERTVLIGEFAQSVTDLRGTGQAARLAFAHEGDRLNARVLASETGDAFDNPGATASRGRREINAEGAVRLGRNIQLVAEAIYSEAIDSDEARQGALMAVRRSFDSVTLEVGTRYTRDTQGAETEREVTTARARLTWQPERLPEVQVFGEYERDLTDASNERALVGADYQFNSKGRLYGRHEIIDSFQGPFGLGDSGSQDLTVFGIDYQFDANASAFSEYRARSAFSGEETEAAIGLRNGWELRDGLRLDTSLERVQPLSADSGDSESIAITGALAYTARPRWKASGRIEYRDSTGEDSLLNQVGLAHKLSQRWAFLGRNSLFLRQPSDGDILENWLRVGAAYRPVETNVWNALGRYEWRHSDDRGDDLRRNAHIVSLHGHYQPRYDLHLSGRVASKWVDESQGGYAHDYLAHLVSARALFDVAERWDVGVSASTMFSGDRDTRSHALGFEVGRVMSENLWLSAGYNLVGFDDAELTGTDYTSQGLYLRLRYKFDETLFGPSSRSE